MVAELCTTAMVAERCSATLDIVTWHGSGAVLHCHGSGAVLHYSEGGWTTPLAQDLVARSPAAVAGAQPKVHVSES